MLIIKDGEQPISITEEGGIIEIKCEGEAVYFPVSLAKQVVEQLNVKIESKEGEEK